MQRQKTLATFGAGPFATGDAGGGRFGHYTFDDDPKLLGIVLTEFDNAAGGKIIHYVPKERMEVEASFHFTKHLLIPKMSLLRTSITTSINSLNCKVLSYAHGMNSTHYERHRLIFNMSFVVDQKSSADTMYEPIVEKCAEYMVDLEHEFDFITDPKHRDEVYNVMKKMFDDLSTKGESVVDVRLNGEIVRTLYFKLCPSYRGIEPPEIDANMVPMFIREVELTDHLIEKMDVLSQKIIPKIDGIKSVREIASILELDPSLVARCVRNLHFYECVSLVPIFLYWNTYVATERVHDFYKNQTEINDCLEFVKIQTATAEDGSEIPMPNPEFSDVFRLYLSMKCGKTLEEWVAEEKPRSMGIDEHRLVIFGMHHQFLRKLSIYPICIVNPGNNSLFKACNGKTSLDELSLIHNVNPKALYGLLEESKKFEFVMK